MSDSPASNINLDELGDYKIVGELAGRDDARAYLATRKEDGAPVLIAIARTPPDDDGNALSLLAADTNLLATLSHRNLLPIIEGRWIGTDAFAVITQRVTAPTLDELIAREELPFPRIAAILGEVNGLLDWARQHKIVHRSVTADTLFVENGSDRVSAAFAISPIPFGRVSPIGVDARTIGTLAKAMLSQHSDIANRVVEQTEALLALSHTSENVPDIPAYIASIAMADALKQGEIEYAKASHAIEEEQRLARERLEAEREQHQRDMAEQREQFEKQRAQYQRDLEKEQRALAREHEALAKERAEHQRDREALARERAEHQHDREIAMIPVTYEPEVYASQEPELAESELDAPAAEEALAEPAVVRSAEKPRPSVPIRSHVRSEGRAWWNVGIVAASLLVIAAATTLATGARNKAPRSVSAAATPVASAPVVDSASGSVLQSAVPLPTNVPDSIWQAAADADSTAVRAARRERAARRAAAARREAEASASSVGQQAPSRADTSAPFNLGFMTPFARRDSVAKRDSLTRPRSDSATKRDTLPKRDSLAPRDTTGGG